MAVCVERADGGRGVFEEQSLNSAGQAARQAAGSDGQQQLVPVDDVSQRYGDQRSQGAVLGSAPHRRDQSVIRKLSQGRWFPGSLAIRLTAASRTCPRGCMLKARTSAQQALPRPRATPGPMRPPISESRQRRPAGLRSTLARSGWSGCTPSRSKMVFIPVGFSHGEVKPGLRLGAGDS